MFYRETHRYTFLFLDIYKYGQPPVYIGLEYEWEIERNLSSQGMEIEIGPTSPPTQHNYRTSQQVKVDFNNNDNVNDKSLTL